MQLPSSILKLQTDVQVWFHDQLAQTKNLRPMLAGGAGVLFLALLIWTIGIANDNAKSLQTRQAELTRLKQQLADGSWAERKKQSETMRFQLFERLWTADTAGLAEASFERWLRERIERKEMRPDSIRIQRAPLPTGGDANRSAFQNVQRMTGKVVMRFEPEALMELLNTTASAEKIMVVDRLLVRSGRNPVIEMDVSTFVLLPENPG